MKKISKVAALLAASALLFGGMFLSCSDSDDDGNTAQVSGPSSNSGSGNSGSGNSGNSGSGDNGGSGNQTETEYKWDFQNIDLSKISVKAWEGQSNASKIHTDYTVGDLANVVLTADYSIASNPAALTLTLEKEKGEYNLIDNDKASGDAKKELGASNGCIDPNADAVVSTSVKGPFTVKMFVSANSESDKTDRHAFIKIGDQTYTDSTYADKVPGTGYWHSASYTGSDTVTVQFGGTGIVRIWDIVITSSAEQTSASGSGSESGSGEQGGSQGGESGSSESGSGEQGGSESGSGESSSTSTTYTLSMDGATITIVANADGTYTASIGENVVETGTYKVSEDGKTVTTTSEKAVTSYTIGDNNVLTVVESDEGEQGGSESGSGESSNTSTTYTLSMDGATITIVANADGTYTASMDGTEVESGTYTLSADGKTVTTTSAKGATSYTIGDNNVLTPVESGEGEQGETCNATFSIKSNVGTDGSLGVVNTKAADIEANLKAEEGSVGATLSFKGNAKIEASAINVQKSSGVTTDEFKNAKGSFDLVLSSSANVTVHYKASGAVETARVVVIADAEGNKITGVSPADNSNEYDLTTPSKLAAGTYKIYVNGCKIYSISAKN